MKRICVLSIALLVICAINVQAGPLDIVKAKIGGLGILGACDAPCAEEVAACEPACADVPACEPACDVPACGCAIAGKLGALKGKLACIKLPKIQLPKLGLLDGCGACAPAADCEVCAPAEVTVEVE